MVGGTVRIAGREVGPGRPCLVIAEAGVNHNGDPARALELVRAAKAAGADCVKFQTFRARTVAVRAAPKAAYQLGTTDPGESQLEMLRSLELPREAHPRLKKEAEEIGIIFFSAPGDEDDADFLFELGVPAVKTASFQLVEHAFLRHLAAKGRPLIVSTGMASGEEVDAAVEVLRGAGAAFALLQCTSDYPSSLDEANLRVIPAFRERYGVPIGYSDHTLGSSAALAAVALGACVLEKHFTLDKSLPGPDHKTSLDPGEFAALVAGVREVERALGRAEKARTPAEEVNLKGMRRSVVAESAIPRGTRIERRMLSVKRPGTGISPNELGRLVGATAARDLGADEVIRWEDVSLAGRSA